jgi:hypothetical protein
MPLKDYPEYDVGQVHGLTLCAYKEVLPEFPISRAV